MGLLLVRDKQTGVERTVTEKAYSIIPHRYTVIAKVDEAGNTESYSPPVKTEKKSANPAAVVDIPSFDSPGDEVREHIAPVVDPPAPTAEQPAAPAAEVKAKKKPGPKPSVERRQGSRNNVRTSENG